MNEVVKEEEGCMFCGGTMKLKEHTVMGRVMKFLLCDGCNATKSLE